MQNEFRGQPKVKMAFRLKIGPDLMKLWKFEVGQTFDLGICRTLELARK